MLHRLTIAFIAVAMLAGQASAIVQMYLDEFDDVRNVNAVADDPRVKASRRELDELRTEILHLKRSDLESVLGKSAEKPAKRYAIPLGETRGIALSGLRDASDKRPDTDFVSFYPLADSGAVEVYYDRQRPDDAPIAAIFYLKVNEAFPKLAKDNLDQRLAWEQVQLAKLAHGIMQAADRLPSGAAGKRLGSVAAHMGRETPSHFADRYIELIAAGDWSQPVANLSGRLLIAEGRLLGASAVRETLVYLELQNVSDAAGEPMSVYFDPGELRCELRDALGKPVPQTPGAGSGGRPGACWVTLPHDAAVRLRANPYGFGRPKDVGLLIPLADSTWLIPAGDARDYFVLGTFTVTAPKDDKRPHAWEGKLELPKMSVSAKRR